MRYCDNCLKQAPLNQFEVVSVLISKMMGNIALNFYAWEIIEDLLNRSSWSRNKKICAECFVNAFYKAVSGGSPLVRIVEDMIE
jgi:hypothetical protein